MVYMCALFPEHCKGCISSDIPATWEPIVSAAMTRIVAAEPSIRFQQVKAKFGGLRLYCHPETPTVEAIIEQAERDVMALEDATGNPSLY